MGLCKIILLTFLIGLVSFFWLNFAEKEYSVPDTVYEDRYWGKKVLKAGDPLPKDDETIKPFKVVYDEAVVKDLHLRLNNTRFVEPLNDVNGFENGFNGNYLKKVVHYWLNFYDWRKQINYLNSFPQFQTQIEGLNVHFVRIKPLGSPNIVKPIVLVNGWPSNYYQYYKLAELLRKPMGDIGFEIILPSRPGYGFSDHPNYSGFSITDAVRIYAKLMKRLGHKKIFFVGEDWGAIESYAITALYPDNIEGLHLSMGFANLDLKTFIKMAIGQYFPTLIYSDEFEAEQFTDLNHIFKIMFREMGYFMIQSTKPDTVGASLIDSPAGLAAYVLEKYSTWVCKNNVNQTDGALTKKLNLDELLTNIMIFWITENGAYASRYYKEFADLSFSGFNVINKLRISQKVPAGFSIGEHELDIGKIRPTGKFNIVKFDYIKNTGHFAAFENPTELNEHLRKFVSIVLEQNEKPKNTEL